MESKNYRLVPIVRELLTSDPQALNQSMAEEASKRLGIRVDRKDVSSVRNLIGLGHYQQIDEEVARRLSELS